MDGADKIEENTMFSRKKQKIYKIIGITKDTPSNNDLQITKEDK